MGLGGKRILTAEFIEFVYDQRCARKYSFEEDITSHQSFSCSILVTMKQV
jgi:hypothetical protein